MLPHPDSVLCPIDSGVCYVRRANTLTHLVLSLMFAEGWYGLLLPKLSLLFLGSHRQACPQTYPNQERQSREVPLGEFDPLQFPMRA